MWVPGRISNGSGVMTRNFRKGGVRRSRLWASEKKGKTSSMGRGRKMVRSMEKVFTIDSMIARCEWAA